MKIVVIGGSGLIGSKAVAKLRALGHDVVAASPSYGVDTTTGKGLSEALKNAQVVIDVANAPSFEDKAVLEFFESSNRNLLPAEKAANVKHHIALSVVGTDRLSDSGYFRGKLAQEKLIKESPVPYTIVRATQFYEFLNSIAQASAVGDTVRLPTAFFQPMAADDVASALVEIALAEPKNKIIEIGGPNRVRISDFVAKYLKATNDVRTVISDEDAGYFGSKLEENTLVPGKDAKLEKTDLETWLQYK